jgi:DNA-binding LytR/AlgR family response regulator
MINCIVVDEFDVSDKISGYCSDIQFINLQKIFTSTIEASRYLRKNQIDLIFLNTDYPNISGIEFYEALNQNILVVFISESKDHAIKAFDLNAVDYLLNSFDLKRFIQAINKVNELYIIRNQNSNAEEQFLQVRSEYSLVKIALVEIVYIETLDDYIKIHVQGKKPILTLMSIKKALEKLPARDFIRVHRSYIVPINRIESVRGKVINLGITEIPIGKSHEEAFFKAYVSQSF